MPGTTPNKLIRYPLPAEYGTGDAGMERLAFDLDTAYTAEDTNRLAATKRPRAAVYGLSGSISIAKNTTTVAAGYTTVAYDTVGMANLGVSNDRLTVQAAGIYLIRFRAEFINSGVDLGANGYIQAGIQINTLTTQPNYRARKWGRNSTGLLEVACWCLKSLAALDTVRGDMKWSGTPAGPFSMDYMWLSVAMVTTNP